MALFLCSECQAEYLVPADEDPTGLCIQCSAMKAKEYNDLAQARLNELQTSGKFEDAEARAIATQSAFNEVYRGILIIPIPTCRQCGVKIPHGEVCAICCRE